jgi:hypothetical protein
MSQWKGPFVLDTPTGESSVSVPGIDKTVGLLCGTLILAFVLFRLAARLEWQILVCLQ